MSQPALPVPDNRKRFPELHPALDAKAGKQLRLLWISCGKEDGLLEGNQKLVEWLNLKGVHPLWTETPGEHSFRVWRRNLASFTPLLFR